MALDEATTALLGQLAASGLKPLHEMTPDEARGLGGMLRELSGPGPEVAGSTDETVPTPDGGSFTVRVLVPNGTPRGVIVYYHGGGWVIGALDEFDTLGRQLAARTGAVVVLVDYRLAPEHRYPTAAEDAWTALRWTERNLARLAGARVPLIVAGDSAGGNLAAVVSRRAHAEGGPDLALQVLVYPVTDADTENASYRDPANQLMLTREAMIWFWDHYAPDHADRARPDASPAQALDLAGLPPAAVLTAEHDVLRDEGEAYVQRLRAAGVPVEHRRFAGQMHGFFTMVNVLPGAAEGLEFVAGRVAAALDDTSGPPTDTVDAVVVGAGVAGLYQLYRLRGMGLRTRVVEAASGVGGTWYWNRYPGARCDVESLSYSYSFSPELEQEWTWSEKYATQPEILRYLEHVADRFDLRRDISFDTRVSSAVYDESRRRWSVRTDTGEHLDAQFVIMATGCLSVSKAPEIPGAERFAGPIHHTGHWPHEGVEFTGQRLGVIGTGSSGIQSIPIMAGQAADTTVFQRTPNFSMPAGNRPLPAEEVDAMKASYPQWRDGQRHSGFGVPIEEPTQSALEAGEAERNAKYQAGWEQGNLVAILASYTDTLTDAAANDTAAEFIRSKIRSVVRDPELAEALSPRSFPVGTKRPCLDSGYYETFNRENVHLVDLRRTPLVEITERGVRTSEREYEFDAIVFATGFDAMTGALTGIDIRGVGGVSLKDKWGDGPRTYLGIAVAGFPNLFTITGPTSPSVFSNMMVSIEQHVDWITDLITHLRERGLDTADATEAAQDEWVAHNIEVGDATLFPTAQSWYMGSNVPGKPRVLMAYIGGVGVYRDKCDEVAAHGYPGFTFSSEPSLTGARA
jgi:cation diffusion facilitator CzcD-associated flavoprotein CzcO